MKKERILKRLKEAGEWVSGSHQHWYRRLLPQYGSWRKRQLEARIRKEQKRVLYRMGICTVLLVICIGWALFPMGTSKPVKRSALDQIIREGGGLVLTYGEARQEFRLEAFDEPELTGKNQTELLREARNQISQRMLNHNPDWEHISGPLDFPRQLDSGIYVYYKTSDPNRISSEGEVDGIGAESGVPVTIEVTMLLGSAMEQYSLECIVIPPQTKEEEIQALQMRVKTLEASFTQKGNGLSTDDALNGVELMTPEGENYGWSLVIIVIVMMTVIMAGRFSEVEKQRETRKKKLAEELPMLMDELILMMNAGLILSEALEMAALPMEGEDSLKADLRFLCQRAEETKRPVVSLLCEYAVETGCPELVRFSIMLSDHVNRGSAALIQQLKMERNFSMESQWKQREGKYRRMEVQLSGPLFLLFGVILMVTIGPVMIGM